MNFDDAISAHTQWKTRLRGLIAGHEELDVVKLSVDHTCALGAWIHGEGQTFAAEPAYQKLRTVHAAFHKHAAAIAQRAKAGDKSGATAALDGIEYQTASQDVVMAIQILRKVVEGKR